MAHGWLTGAVDRRLCSLCLADLRSDHGLRSSDGAAMWLSATETQSVDQTSVFLRHTQRKVAGETGGDQGFTPVIIMMPWDVMLWIPVCARFILCLKWSEHSGCHRWLTDLQGWLGNFAKSMKLFECTLCKHISCTLMALWVPNQYQISASILSARTFWGSREANCCISFPQLTHSAFFWVYQGERVAVLVQHFNCSAWERLFGFWP